MLFHRSKYKILLKSKKVIDIFPLRIKKFKRSKWKFFLSKIFSNRKKKTFRYRLRRYKFKNLFSRTFPKRRYRFIRIKKYYKECLLRKIHLQQMYNNSFCFRSLKQKVSKKKNLRYIDLFKYILVQHLYYLKILLWYLHFFSSTKEAAYFINRNYVFVNNKNVSSNYLLKLGDIITFHPIILEDEKLNYRKKSDFFNKIFFFSKKFKSQKILSKFYSHIEIDYYSYTVIIVKDFASLNMDDCSYLFSRPFNVTYVFNNIK